MFYGLKQTACFVLFLFRVNSFRQRNSWTICGSEEELIGSFTLGFLAGASVKGADKSLDSKDTRLFYLLYDKA